MNKKKITGRSIHLIVLLTVFGLINNRATLSAEELRAHPASIVFNAVQGHNLTDSRSIFIFTALGTSIDWSMSKNVPWLSADQTDGLTNGVLKVNVITTGMLSGIYSGNIILHSTVSTSPDIVISVTLVINPDVPVKLTDWKDGYGSAMSVSVDDSQASGFDALQTVGASGTYAGWYAQPPSFYTDYYNAGMELGSHTVTHPCWSVTDNVLRNRELEPNIAGIVAFTPQPKKDLITLVWPCGYTNYREQGIATDYYLCARGYNINQLEDRYPENFMNLKSFNSHEHSPDPPADLKTVVDAAIAQKKWFNLVLHNFNNDDGAIVYSHAKDIWVTSIGSVIKYIMQRERLILSDYIESPGKINYKVSRLPIPSSPLRTFEDAFGSNDVVTMQIDIPDDKVIEYITIDGVKNPYKIKNIAGNKVLLTNVWLESVKVKAIEIKYLDSSTIGLTVSGVTANSKVYNGDTAATLNVNSIALAGVIPGDDVSLISTSTGTFTDKNIGLAKTVFVTGFSLTGNDAGKYTLIAPVLTANITKAGLTISGVTANSKVYNATTATTLNKNSAVLNGVIGLEDVRLVTSGAAGSFSDKNIGAGKSVVSSGFILNGNDAGNYTLLQPTMTANISTSGLTIRGIITGKVYDGTVVAVLDVSNASLSGIFGSDDVDPDSDNAVGTYTDKNAGNGKSVTTSGFTLIGPDANNYTLTQPVISANITRLALNISGVTANNKVYNGTTTAILNNGTAALTGIIGGDDVSLSATGATGTFINKNVASGKVVFTSGFTLGGSDAGNYSITQPSLTADISVAGLTVTGVTANNKVYDGNTATGLSSAGAVIHGFFGTDVVTLVSTSAAANFTNRNVGNNKDVVITGLTLGGTDGTNYSLTQPSPVANITPATLVITGLSAYNKVYDGNTHADLNVLNATLSGIFTPDQVSLNTATSTGTFNNKKAGTGKVVSTSGFTLSGADAGNYNLSQPNASADITPSNLTISGVSSGKVYNQSTSAPLNNSNATLNGLMTGDNVNLLSSGATGSFTHKNAGTGKIVSTSGYSLSGPDAGNYFLTQPSFMAEITRAVLRVSGVTADNKVYDGTNTARLNTITAAPSGVFSGDNVSIISSMASGVFSGKNAGAGIQVSTSGFMTNGTDAENYSLIQPSLLADITPKSLKVIANDHFKHFNSELIFTGTEFSTQGLVEGDPEPIVSISSQGAPSAAAIGQYLITINGTTTSNYNPGFTSGTLTVGKVLLTVRAEDKSKFYGSANPELSLTYSGFINNDDPSMIDVKPVISTSAGNTSPAGEYVIALTGGSDNIYDLDLENGQLNVMKTPLTITADDISRIYGELNPDLTITYSGFVAGEDQSFLDLVPVAVTAAKSGSDAGNYDINVSGGEAANYSFIYNKGTFKIKKADQIISFGNIPDDLRMTQQYSLNATSTSGLTVSFEISNIDKAIVDGNILTIKKDGNITITAKQEGNIDWNPATELSKTISALPTFDDISSLFTPNNDGMNDYWYIPAIEQYGKVQATVYNRFGQPVFQTGDYKNDWDGTWNEHPLPSGAYYYVIISSTRGLIKGVVNIVR